MPSSCLVIVNSWSAFLDQRVKELPHETFVFDEIEDEDEIKR